MSLMPLGILGQSTATSGGSGNALTLISTQILASTATSVTFSSIPSTYKHLQLRVVARGNGGSTSNMTVAIRFNSDTANQAYHRLTGSGSSVGSSGNSAGGAGAVPGLPMGIIADSGESASIFGSAIVDILDYANTNKNKTTRSLTGTYATAASVRLTSAYWSSTSAISTLLVSDSNFTTGFAIGSRFSLYGVS